MSRTPALAQITKGNSDEILLCTPNPAPNFDLLGTDEFALMTTGRSWNSQAMNIWKDTSLVAGDVNVDVMKCQTSLSFQVLFSDIFYTK